MVLEPGVVRDAGWAGQRVLDVNGSVSGTTLTISSGSFVDSEVDAGSVALIDSLAVEVVSRTSATQAVVSLLRSDATGAAVAPPVETNRPVKVYTFGPQLAMVHRQVLSMIGIDPDGGSNGDQLDESAVTNPGALVRLEALGALHLIYAAAAAPGRGGQGMADRAALYKERFGAERERVVATIDTDGDGIAEVSRRPSVFSMTRG